jgi:hypothetical protein
MASNSGNACPALVKGSLQTWSKVPCSSHTPHLTKVFPASTVQINPEFMFNQRGFLSTSSLFSIFFVLVFDRLLVSSTMIQA